MDLFKTKNLTYFYPEEDAASLDKIDLTINEGDFVLLMGPSGCGKSSLLKAMAGLLPDYYGGKINGDIYYSESPISKFNKVKLAKEVGIIFQDPEKQIVMTNVEQEIAFGLENINLPYQQMRRRVAEVLSLFGLTSLKKEKTFNLSGGEKQKAILASVLAMHPRVLLLDEPTSQLDPLSAQEFLNYVQRLNQEWGLTVVLVEQRIDRCYHLADKVVFMENGRILKQDNPRAFVKWASEKHYHYIPPIAQFFTDKRFKSVISSAENIPLTIKEGRSLLNSIIGDKLIIGSKKKPVVNSYSKDILKLSKVCTTYNNRDFVLKKLDLSLYENNIAVVLGENGAGKSTLLKTISGLIKPVKGKITAMGKDLIPLKPEEIALNIGYLSQNPNDYLFNDTVEEEIAFNLKIRGMVDNERVEELLDLLKLNDKRSSNPRDLSGGERQRVALGTVLATNPDIILLDEPTRGLDLDLKVQMGDILKALKNRGVSILIVTHDIEFAAEVTDRVIIIADGEIITDGEKREVLADSLYYAPQINRLLKGIDDKAVNIDDAVSLIKSLLDEQAIG